MGFFFKCGRGAREPCFDSRLFIDAIEGGKVGVALFSLFLPDVVLFSFHLFDGVNIVIIFKKSRDLLTGVF